MDEMIVSVHSSHMDLLVTGIVCYSSCSTDITLFQEDLIALHGMATIFWDGGLRICTSKKHSESQRFRWRGLTRALSACTLLHCTDGTEKM